MNKILIVIIACVLLIPFYAYNIFFRDFSIIALAIIHLVVASIILLVTKNTVDQFKIPLFISLILGVLILAFNFYTLNINNTMNDLISPEQGFTPTSFFNAPNPYYTFITFILCFNIPSVIFLLVQKHKKEKI